MFCIVSVVICRFCAGFSFFIWFCSSFCVFDCAFVSFICCFSFLKFLESFIIVCVLFNVMYVFFQRIFIVFFIFVLCSVCFVPVLAGSVDKNMPLDFKVKQLEVPGFDGIDVYFWPYFSLNKSQYGTTNPINVVFVGKTRAQVTDFMKQRGMGDLFVIAYPEYGYRGSDLGNLSWDISTNLEEGRGILGSSGRHHLLLFDGGYSKKLETNWCYGNIHNESVCGLGHCLNQGAFDEGVKYLDASLSKKIRSRQTEVRRGCISLGNGDDWFFNGESLLVTWGSSFYKLEKE